MLLDVIWIQLNWFCFIIIFLVGKEYNTEDKKLLYCKAYEDPED